MEEKSSSPFIGSPTVNNLQSFYTASPEEIANKFNRSHAPHRLHRGNLHKSLYGKDFIKVVNNDDNNSPMALSISLSTNNLIQ